MLVNIAINCPRWESLDKNNLLKNKHIPIDYIVNDEETRLKVLAGLIDTDGSVRANGREIRICQGPKNFRIIDDAHKLSMSLGFSCSVKEGISQWTDKKTNAKKYSNYKELTITGYNIDGIVMCSIYGLPDNPFRRYELLKLAVENNVEIHFANELCSVREEKDIEHIQHIFKFVNEITANGANFVISSLQIIKV